MDSVAWQNEWECDRSNHIEETRMYVSARVCPLIVLIGLLGFSSANAAGYVNNRQQWLSMQPEARAAYAQGMNDSQNFIFADDTLADAMVKRGRTKCLLDLKTGADTLAENITFMYKNNDYSNLPPSAMYIITMGKLCKVYIDIERSNFGLGPS